MLRLFEFELLLNWRIGQLVGDAVAPSTHRPKSDDDRKRRRNGRQLRLSFPKGLRLRPGKRYQEAAYRDTSSTAAAHPEPASDADFP